MTQCNACEGNVSHGKSCYLCGRKGPLGQGWQMRAMELEADLATLRAQLAEVAPIIEEHADAVSALAASPVGDLDFVEGIEALVAQLAAPLRLGKGPTVEEAAMHTSVGGLWLLGYGGGKWREIVLPSTTWGVMGREAIEPIDAIPLNAARQPCRVGVKS